jgi:transposase InsO family protein
VLTVVDLFSRYVPVLDPRFSYRAENVVQTLQTICAVAGYPKTIRVDQGSEFISRDLDLWAYVNGVTLDFSRPGKPTDNAFIEAFNGRFRCRRDGHVHSRGEVAVAESAVAMCDERTTLTVQVHPGGYQRHPWKAGRSPFRQNIRGRTASLGLQAEVATAEDKLILLYTVVETPRAAVDDSSGVVTQEVVPFVFNKGKPKREC